MDNINYQHFALTSAFWLDKNAHVFTDTFRLILQEQNIKTFDGRH